MASPEAFQDLVKAERLPEHFTARLLPVLDILAEAITARRRRGRSIAVGINGPQGSGKSTLALFLKRRLELEDGARVAILSLDDLYLTRQDREDLGRRVHPLLRTRGVPGTHDVPMGLNLFARLMTAAPDTETALVRFDKARDDRATSDQWERFQGQADIILFEGWCVGVVPEQEAALVSPINALEAEQDADGTWRRYVNRCIAETYAALFAQLDLLVVMHPSDFDVVFAWRKQQEDKLRDKRRTLDPHADLSGVMDDAQLRTFIMHYERLTRHMLRSLPALADVMIALGDNREIVRTATRS